MNLRTLHTEHPDFWPQLHALHALSTTDDTATQATVAAIIAAVRARGDAALLEYTARYDHHSAACMADLELPAAQLAQAYQQLAPAERDALNLAAQRIRTYAEHQKLVSWEYREADGTRLGQVIRPLDRVGIYVPGGKAAYPSSVLMNALPAHVAGVAEIIMVVPTPHGEVNPWVLAAAHLAGVSRVFRLGGAQAVAALAYGTATVPAVDKIVGPGNRYVAEAKRQVFGQVGIDMIAGPSEILIICDGSVNPDWIALDLCSQAEHDEDAAAILVSPDAAFLSAVQLSLQRLVPTLERAAITQAALARRGLFVQVADLTQAAAVANALAPEHLQLAVTDPDALLPLIRHGGAIFLGAYTPEALGDYCAGPNHVLPTARSARYASPLGVYDFQKRSSLIHCSAQGAATLARTASILARAEGLTAHARSAEYRLLAITN
jgi:histidinol dehydrogenase